MEKKTAVEWLVEQLDGERHLTDNEIKTLIKLAKKKEKEMLCDLVQSLKDYTKESQIIFGYDEREPIEFVEIFLK
jgi:hypothetical protein